ncbi:hypothetical protein ACP4OV_003268 [Aristida adscensionis]
MDVQVQRSFIVPTPPSEPSSEVPLTAFDLVAPTYHVTVLHAFAPPNPTNAGLLAALAATLPRFPLLTGRLERRGFPDRSFFVTGKGGAGALVVEAAVASPLSDLLPLAPSPELAQLHAPVGEATPHLLRLQINRFACGGLVIATAAHHQAADGHSMSTFFHAWVDAVRADDGAPPLDRPLPYGPAALAPRRPPRCEFDHRGAEFLPRDAADGERSRPAPAPAAVRVDPSEITNMLLHYTGEFVGELKAAAQGRYTTFETVSAHLWRKINVARGRRGDGAATTKLNVAVNGRARLGGAGAGVPRGFFGNVVLTATAEASSRDLARGGLADAAALVRAAVRAVDRRYFQSFIDFVALHGGEELEPVAGAEDGVLLPDVEADSWMHLELHRLDFGRGGRLVGILPAKVPVDGVVVLMPSLQKGGGVDVFVSLWEKHAEELRNIAYSMD